MSLTTTGGTSLAYDDDVSSSNRNAQIVFTPKSSGDYLVNVAENGSNGTGSYTFTISAGFASDYNDSVSGSGYGDAIAGLSGNDRINGLGGNDYLYGQNGWDTLRGGDGNDNLVGGAGNDILLGEDDNDVLNGGVGGDRIVGGIGSDRFVYTSVEDSKPGAFDIITGDGGRPFSGVGEDGGDVLDLSAIDANPYASGNQAFRFASGPLTTGVAQLYEDSAGNTIFVASTDTDTTPELMIRIVDESLRATAYTADEFIL